MTEPQTIEELEHELFMVRLEAEQTKSIHSKVKEERESHKKAASFIREETAQEIYAMQVELQSKADEMRRLAAEKTKEHDEAYEALKNDEWDARVKANEEQRKLESLERQLEQMRRALLKAAEFATLEQRWDLMTMGAPWREWSKDHQISGAKKMTYEGKMILGDTMGLGKTLTSLMAIDMIEAATKDASPDNPINFGAD